ncbi:hypothetical protein [Streptomyces qinglanensis]|uniref:hypothetical protein n=1 Tax=Streptomyces qinglanensis TaxID=943816 RepID=UPI001160DFB4|nr:hypothetical protein [Streptomyces qinglanensis]
MLGEFVGHLLHGLGARAVSAVLVRGGQVGQCVSVLAGLLPLLIGVGHAGDAVAVEALGPAVVVVGQRPVQRLVGRSRVLQYPRDVVVVGLDDFLVPLGLWPDIFRFQVIEVLGLVVDGALGVDVEVLVLPHLFDAPLEFLAPFVQRFVSAVQELPGVLGLSDGFVDLARDFSQRLQCRVGCFALHVGVLQPLRHLPMELGPHLPVVPRDLVPFLHCFFQWFEIGVQQ